MKKKIVALLLGMSLAVSCSGSVWAAGYSQVGKINTNINEIVNGDYELEYGRFGVQMKIEKGVIGEVVEIYEKNSENIIESVGRVETLGSTDDSEYVFIPNNFKYTYGKLCNGKAEIIVADIKTYRITDDGKLLMYTDKNDKKGFYDLANKKIMNMSKYVFEEDFFSVYQRVNDVSYLVFVTKNSKHLPSYKNGEVNCHKTRVINLATLEVLDTEIPSGFYDKIVLSFVNEKKKIMALTCYNYKRDSSNIHNIRIDSKWVAKHVEFDGYEFLKTYQNSEENTYRNFVDIISSYVEIDAVDELTMVFRKKIDHYQYKYLLYMPDQEKVIDLKGTYFWVRPFDQGRAIAKINGKDNLIVLDESENILEVIDDNDYFDGIMLDEKTSKPVYIGKTLYGDPSNYRYTVDIFSNGSKSSFQLPFNGPDEIVNKVVDGVVYYDHCSYKPVKNDDGKISYDKEEYPIENFNNLSQYVNIKVEENDNFIFTFYESKYYNSFDEFLMISKKLGDTIIKVDNPEDGNFFKEINKNTVLYKAKGKYHIYFDKENKDIEFEDNIMGYNNNLSVDNLGSISFIKHENGDYIIVDSKGKNKYPKFSSDRIKKLNDHLYSYEGTNDYEGFIRVKEDGGIEIKDPIYTDIDTSNNSNKIIVKSMIGLVGALNQDGTEFIKTEFDNIKYVTDSLFITKDDGSYNLYKVIK